MQKVFSAGIDTGVLVAANEEFPPAQTVAAHPPENRGIEVHGWSAYEIWHSRIRPLPGVGSPFLPQR